MRMRKWKKKSSSVSPLLSCLYPILIFYLHSHLLEAATVTFCMSYNMLSCKISCRKIRKFYYVYIRCSKEKVLRYRAAPKPRISRVAFLFHTHLLPLPLIFLTPATTNLFFKLFNFVILRMKLYSKQLFWHFFLLAWFSWRFIKVVVHINSLFFFIAK